MPDWTYLPLRRPMGALLGVRRSRHVALASLATLASLPGGKWLVAGLGHTSPPLEGATTILGIRCPSRFGASVGTDVAQYAVGVFPLLGAGLIEIGPCSLDSVGRARQVFGTLNHPLALRVAGNDALAVAEALGPRADLVILDMSDSVSSRSELDQLRESMSVPVAGAIDAGQVIGLPHDLPVVIRNASPVQVEEAVRGRRTVIATFSTDSPKSAADLIDAGAVAVLATPTALIEAGPGWFHRATMAHLARVPTSRPASPAVRLGWMAGLALGLGMIAGGVGATLVAIGPVLLPYDVSYLGVTSAGLAVINPRLVHFLQHDRITLSGTLIAIGILYSCLSWWGIRAGRTWARDALLASGLVGFPTLFYFFAYRYVEPVHVTLAAILFPLFVLATWRRVAGAPPVVADEGPSHDRHRALLAQLLMVTAGAGLVFGGLTISFVGLVSVFVPSDLSFLNTTPQALAANNARLLSFIAHDRAGFGGALMSAGVAVTLIAAWGWERGQAWVWWSLTAAAAVGFGAALAIHFAVAYTDFAHVAPLYVGLLLAAIALGLARPFLLASRAGAPGLAATASGRVQ